ncbi:ABC transporter substrate-binding protein [Streptomyces fuscichromogenes]|uniref:ABC transporter substrate-binding protein n=1 Tax=Streptomyces fuscichromogenes TaxID=1324013 RepID=UPI00382BF8B1
MASSFADAHITLPYGGATEITKEITGRQITTERQQPRMARKTLFGKPDGCSNFFSILVTPIVLCRAGAASTFGPIVWHPGKESVIVKIRMGMVGLVTAVLTATSACGSGGSSPKTEAPSASKDSKISALLPQTVKDAGVIKAASDATYPPMEFLQGGKTLTGFDIDLGNALGQVLGVKIQWTNLSAASIIPGLENGRFDLAMTSAQDTPERRKAFTFVDYLNSGSDLMVTSGNPKKISDFASLCGLKLGVQAGTTQLNDAKATSAKDCSGNPVDIQTFQTNDQANLALNSKRVVAVFAQSATNAYVTSVSKGQYEVVSKPYNPALIGACMSKDSKLVKAVQAGIQKLIDDGTYKTIVDKWNLKSSSVATATVNGA